MTKIGIIGAGIAGAVAGQRELEHEAATEQAEGNAVREVAARANTLGTITAAGDRATISLTAGPTTDVLSIPKALPVNVLFVNGEREPRRLVIDAGEVPTGASDADGNPVTEPLTFETEFVQPGKVNFLTFRIPNPGTFEFRIEGERGADPVTGRLIVS